MSFVSKMRNTKRPFVTRPSEHIKVEPKLSYTPASMKYLADKGVPVSSMTVDESLFYDGDSRQEFDVPLEDRRGIDISEAWEAEQSARRNLLAGFRRDKDKYGD